VKYISSCRPRCHGDVQFIAHVMYKWRIHSTNRNIPVVITTTT